MKQNVRVVFRVQQASGGEPWIRLKPIDKNQEFCEVVV
jgi:hypothetical protein